MKKLIQNGLIVLFLVFSVFAQAQDREVTGTIVDQAGETLPGATVLVKGTSVGTSSDFDGNFTIMASDSSTLVFSFMGYDTQEVAVGSNSTFNITLIEDASALEEVVVVAYGTQKKENITSSITTVKAEELTDITSASAGSMLQGKAAGVQVTPSTGSPGANPRILIRGAASLNGNIEALWVVDGVIQSGTPVINPNDIETTSILKDASATSLYGSRGANGVIIVTTKRAKKGQNAVTFSAKTGINQFNANNFEVMDSKQLYDYHELMGNTQAWFTPDLLNRDHNWVEGSTQNALVQDYNLSYKMANDKTNTYIAGGYYSEEGTVKGKEFERFTFRMNNDYIANKWLTLKPKIAVSYDKGASAEHNRYSMYTYLPWDRPIDDDGNVINAREESSWIGRDASNYYYDLQWNSSNYSTFNFSINGDFDIKLSDSFTYSSVNNVTFSNYGSMYYTDPQSLSGLANTGEIGNSSSRSMARLFTQMLRFNKAFGDHDINAVAGYEYNDGLSEWFNASGIGIIPGTTVLDVTSSAQSVGGSKSEYALQSMFFDASYAYNDKYFAKGSLRRDGASNFGPDNKYATFYSLGAGWTISNEDFFNVDQINLLKFRISNGTVGNRPPSPYPYQGTYAVGVQYGGVPGVAGNQFGNPDLTWEKSVETNFAVDTRLFNRINITAEYYNKNTTDLLYRVDIPSVSGYQYYWENVGGLLNSGYELTIDADIFKGDFNWNFAFNIGANRNEITDLFEDQDFIPRSGNKVFAIGEDMNSWYMRQWAGVNSDDGKPLWEVLNSETGEITHTSNYNEATLQLVGNATPDFIGGFSSNMDYKGFSLSMNFAYMIGGEIYNSYRSLYDSDGAYPTYNQQILSEGWSRWEKAGDDATHPQAIYGGNSLSNKTSSRYLEDRSFLKLRNITLGYTMPQTTMQSIGLQSGKIYIAGDNLFTLTNYSGMDPEVVTLGGNPDGAPYPMPRRFVLGLNLSF